uniref:Ribonuclease H n=1 Tax=Pithovirus LCPAC102 TaxID=2506587 RepID=A0A481Z455_9VIRU|nr:MAG: ribonuclease H [Pithovirus LCPAC102]
MPNYYVVKIGRTPGIYTTWYQCNENVNKFSGAIYKKFTSLKKAEDWINDGIEKNNNIILPRKLSSSDPFKLLCPSPKRKKTNFTSPHNRKYNEISQSNNLLNINNTIDIAPYHNNMSLYTNITTKSNNTSSSNDIIQNNTISASTNKSQVINNRLIIYTDGACKNNGYNTQVGGIGVFMDDNSPYNLSEKIEGYVTNNRAELWASIRGIQVGININKQIEIRSDSMYVINGITKWINTWKRKQWKNIKNYDLWIILDNLNMQNDIIWTHVKAHSGIYGNEMADTYANICLY